jgi:hypothetical protein
VSVETQTDSNWLQVGQKAAAWSGDRVRLVTITKITKRDVVVDGGTRYRRQDLYEHGRGSWSDSRLADPNSPRVVAQRIKQRRASARRRASDNLESWERTADAVYARQAISIIQAELNREERLL